MGLKWSLGQLIILVPLLHVKLYLYCGCGHPKKKFNPSGEEFLRLFGHLLLFFQMFHNVSPLIGRTNYSKVIFFIQYYFIYCLCDINCCFCLNLVFLWNISEALCLKMFNYFFLHHVNQIFLNSFLFFNSCRTFQYTLVLYFAN